MSMAQEKIPNADVIEWIFDWLEANNYPMYLKGRIIGADIQKLHMDRLKDRTVHGIAGLVGRHLVHPEELGYKQYSRGHNGYTYARVKVLLRSEFKKDC